MYSYTYTSNHYGSIHKYNAACFTIYDSYRNCNSNSKYPYERTDGRTCGRTGGRTDDPRFYNSIIIILLFFLLFGFVWNEAQSVM